MTKFAWVESNTIRDVCRGDPNTLYHATVAAHYSAIVPDEAQNGWGWDGVTLTPPPPPVPPTPEQQAAQQAATAAAARPGIHLAIRAERDRRKFNGVFVSGEWIHTDTYSRTQWLAMVMMGASIPTVEWTTLDNTTITTSQALAAAVFNATATLDVTLFAHAKSLIAAVDAATDPYSVDITAGWPATFGE